MNSRNILVKLSRNDSLIAVTTISRKHLRQGRFLICANNLRHWMQEHERFGETFIDTDCGRYLTIRLNGRKYDIRIAWLNSAWYAESEEVTGHIQNFSIDADDLRSLVFTDNMPEIRRLHQPEWRQSKIIMDARCGVSKNKLVRRAFIKAMRDCFKWGTDENILLYPDGANGYGFVESVDGKQCIRGGLIAHWNNLQASNGRTYTKVTFSVHT